MIEGFLSYEAGAEVEKMVHWNVFIDSGLRTKINSGYFYSKMSNSCSMDNCWISDHEAGICKFANYNSAGIL